MTPSAWLVVVTIALILAALAFTTVAPYIVILSGVTLLFVSGVLSAEQAVGGFSNEGVITIAALYVVGAGLTETGVVARVVQRVLGRPATERAARARLVVPVAMASAFLNNTTVVAMLLPVVTDWGRRAGIAASQLLIPLSYAAILGGLCTLIGTSTNLVVHGLLIETGHPGLALFDITAVGVPAAIAGVAALLLLAPRLLPRQAASQTPIGDPREYTIEMVVEPGGPLVGRSVEQAGLRHLPGLFLAEIHRNGRILPVVGPQERLAAADQLIFVGLVQSVVELQRTPGLRPATRQLFKLDRPRPERWFVEAVVSASCPLVGRTIREGHFRTRYNAVVIAVARHGERIEKRIGDIVLHPGDVLLLEALPSFVEQQRNSSDFYLVSRIEEASPPRHDKAWLALVILGALVLLAATGLLSMLQAALVSAGAMVLTGCCPEDAVRRRIDWPLLLAIGASFALGRALDATGAAAAITAGLLPTEGANAHLALAIVYGLALMMTEVITNNAAAVLAFPIATATAAQLDLSYMPFVVAVMVASSAGFATPLGYQTHLMVYGPGGYRFADFLRIGIPMNLILWTVSVAVIPIVFPFTPPSPPALPHIP